VFTTKPFIFDFRFCLRGAVDAFIGPPPAFGPDRRRQDPDITRDRFPFLHQGIKESMVAIFGFERTMRTPTILRIIDDQGFHSFDLQRLLTYGIGHVKKEFTKRLIDSKPVAGLGSLWQAPDGRCYSPCLYGDSNIRRVHLECCQTPWSPGYLFPAVPGRDPRFPELLEKYKW
jgi:hypothetical protein